MSKKALIFYDDDFINIVIGPVLKRVQSCDVALPHNKAFFDKIFNDPAIAVVYVENVSILTREAFDSLISEGEAPQEQEQAQEPEQETPEEPPAPKPRVVPQQKQQPRRDNKVTQREVQQKANRAVNAAASGLIFKSMSDTTMIIDDLLTDELIYGMPKAVVVPGRRTVNLTSLPADRIANSRILKMMIAQKRLVPISPQEAFAIEEEYNRQLMEDNDARLDQFAPIIDEPASVRAKKGSSSKADAIEISEDEIMQDSDIDGTTGLRGVRSLSELDQLIAQEEEGAPAEEIEIIEDKPKGPSQIEARPRANSGSTPGNAIVRKR